MPGTIITLPQTDNCTLCLRFTGAVTKQDHYDAMVVPGKAIIERNGFYNLVIEYAPDYKGLMPDAADQRFRLISDWGKYGCRVAYVNPSARLVFMTKLARVLLGKADVRFFATNDLDEAIAWAKAGRPGA
jgi:hypothetical protein